MRTRNLLLASAFALAAHAGPGIAQPYQEAPALAEKVSAGELPPVAVDELQLH